LKKNMPNSFSAWVWALYFFNTSEPNK
jgi:hypothetical protein